MVPGGFVVLGLGYALFVSRAVPNKTVRMVSQALALVPGVALYVAMKPASFAGESLVKLSTSQWVALLTGAAAAVAYGMFWNSANAHPTRAMALDLSEFESIWGKKSAPEDATEDVEATAEAKPKKQPKQPKQKAAEGEAPAEKPAAEAG